MAPGSGTQDKKRKDISPAENVSKTKKRPPKNSHSRQNVDIKDLILSHSKKKETINAVRDEWKEDIRELTQTGKTKLGGAKPDHVGHPNTNRKPSKSSNPELDRDGPIRSKGDMTEWFKEALQDNDIRSLLRSSLDPERQIEKNTEKINDLETEVSRLTLELDELEQYGRRNAIRIFNPDWPEQTDENTDEMVLQLIHQKLNIRDFPIWLISRSHRVGQKRNDGTPRPILVKFISYRAREQVFKARRLLPQGVYVNEDLTQATAQLAYQARQLRRNGLIDETWTYDGRVFIKKNGRSRGVLVRSLEDLVETLHDGDDSDEEGRKIAPQQKTPKPGSVRPTKPNTKPTGAADKILSNLNKSSKATPNQKPSHSQGLTSTPINRNPTTTPTPRSKAKRNTNEMTLPVPEHGETINPHDYDLASTNENHTIDGWWIYHLWFTWWPGASSVSSQQLNQITHLFLSRSPKHGIHVNLGQDIHTSFKKLRLENVVCWYQ